MGLSATPAYSMSVPADEPLTPGMACTPAANPATLTSDSITQLVDWVVSPETGLDSLVGTLGPALAASLAARPFPDIHEQARLANVPVMMYHDILPEKEVFFDVTPAEFEAHLRLIQENGLTPISLDQLVSHLSTGIPLPEKPILLSFDDGYEGHYQYVYPLLKEYNYPGVFAIYTAKVGKQLGRSSLSWEQLREMAADPLVTIASHSVNHPRDLSELSNTALRREIVESKRILETELGISIRHFVYPEGKYDDRVKQWVQRAGYRSALTMDDAEDQFANESQDLLSIERIGQSRLESVVSQAYGGPPLAPWGNRFNFEAPVQLNRLTVDDTPLILISGGRPVTIHANSRYQVPEIIANTNTVAAVDGGFFSLKYLDSNVMIGPVLSQSSGEFVPGNPGENLKLKGRPLVLISPEAVRFIPFAPEKHNTVEGFEAELPGVTDAFVAAAWLVKDGKPQSSTAFGSLFDFDALRHRAFWGMNHAGQPVIGISVDRVDSITLGKRLNRAGLRDVVMLDSGASTSLAYQGESLVSYEPRPVPHVVALVPPDNALDSTCALVSQTRIDP
ncbi:polysaccharide deacetylase family protein [Oculatella sp. LEGE 06141]|nr:polysaccharide deacetylase family protein [Oculatella sp. LEGE 06141]